MCCRSPLLEQLPSDVAAAGPGETRFEKLPAELRLGPFGVDVLRTLPGSASVGAAKRRPFFDWR